MMLPMMRNQTMKSWRSAEQWLLGSMVLALAMAAFIWLVLGPAPAAPATLAANEKQTILDRLETTGWKLTETARQLGISRTTLWRRLKEYGVRRDGRGR